jgi:hypothetical protein
MGMALDEIRLSRPAIELGTADWLDYLSMEGLPPDFLAAADHAAFHSAFNAAATGHHDGRMLSVAVRTATTTSTW